MPLPQDMQFTIQDFHSAINMSPEEIERWMRSPEARSAPDAGEDQRVLRLLQTPQDQLTDGDMGEMRLVIDRVREQLVLQPRPQDVAHSRWRYSLMNWGHDPLKDQQGQRH